jgi:hypothetical protein
VVLVAGGGLLVTPTTASADIPGAGIIRDAVGGATGFAFEGIASGIAGWVLGAVADLIGGVVGFLGSTARPSLDAVWFSGPGSPFAVVRGIAFSLLLGFVLLAVIQGLLAGEPAAGAGRVARDVFLAVLGMAATVTVTVKLLDLTDALSHAVLGGAEDQALRFLSGFGSAAGAATGGFGMVLVGLIVAVAALLVWIELIVRAALVYLLVALTPLAFAAMTWPAARGVLRRTVELLLAVIASKFVICVAIAVGAAALGGAGAAGPVAGVAASAAAAGPPIGVSLGALLAGAAILALAAFSPFVVLKVMPLAEAAVMAQGISRSPLRGAQAGMSTQYYASSMRRLSGRGPTGGGGPGSLNGTGPARIGGQASPGQPGGSSTASGSAGGAAGAGGSGGGAAGAAGVAGAGAAAGARVAKAAGTRPGTSADGMTGGSGAPPPSPRQQGTTPPGGNVSGRNENRSRP